MSVSGTGLSEARQLFQVLQDVDRKLDTIKFEADKTQEKITELRLNVHDVNLLLNQTAALMRRIGVGENIIQAYSYIQSLITAVNALRAAMFALMAGAGPVGWAMLGLSAVSVALTIQPSLVSSSARNEMEMVRTH